ncbi:MAG: site-specific DNA-methyltransferase [Chloroflexi bacterium]|nr:site-specific DNA-methyltransferase [Chloroflexota bacterium]
MPSLTWLNDDEARKTSAHIPYRLLEADAGLSHGAADTGNMLIQGDNLEALKALLPYYAGQVKCIYIDPPYNTQSAFEHYDDNLEHSTWLSMMYPRLELLRDLLSEDGSIWVSIDDNEGHYLKAVMDEVFGRQNFRTNVTWQRKYSVSNNYKGIATICDFILVYSKSDSFKNNLLTRTDESKARYTNPDNDPRGPWKAVDYLNQATPEKRPNLCYDIKNPNTGEVIKNTKKAWKYEPETHRQHVDGNRIWWGRDGKNSVPALKLFLSDVPDGMTPHNWWPHEEVGHTDEAKKEMIHLFGALDVFDTPKPERLIKRIFNIATNPGDLVLDSFLGSGTTAAVAQKMGRRYIGIEMGAHAVTHCVPRLQKVIEGEQGGISKDVNWLGGGGFRFYRLGETVFDEFGNINPAVRFKELAAHVWFVETKTPLPEAIQQTGDEIASVAGERSFAKTSLLGIHHESAIYLLYNGILGDRRPEEGNVLTSRVLEGLPPHTGPRVIYGEYSTLDEAILHEMNITFKHIPYDIKAR